MFQLIVAVISIALVAALAIASIFYGGEAFQKSSEKSAVTALVNQGQQIASAIKLYQIEAGQKAAWEFGNNKFQELITEKYLSAIPSPQNSFVNGDWQALATASVDQGYPFGVLLSPSVSLNGSFCKIANETKSARCTGYTDQGHVPTESPNPSYVMFEYKI